MAGRMSGATAPSRAIGRRGPAGGHGPGRVVEKPKDFRGTMLKLLGYVGRHKVGVLSAVVFAMASVIFNIVGPKVLGSVTTKLYEGLVAKVAGTGSVDFDWIGKTLLLLLGLYLASSACNLVQGWLMTGVTQKICYRMRKEIAEKITVVPMSYFNGHSKGDVLSRITNDVDTLGQSLNQSVTQLITSITQIVGVLVMMLSISLPLTGVVVVTLPAAAVIMGVMMHFSQPYFREQQQVLGAVNGIIEEDFAGQNVIQVFDRADAAVREFDEKNDRLFISGWRSQFLSGL
ncbi:MAG: ABC transporter ATP-binding protein, partial [Atopobiaceae bacterium]|nr:ABC transporter ATP-binding protein [Atopobiaceae bacterium]